MTVCEFLSTCKFLNGNVQNLPSLKENILKKYCHGEFSLCGSYTIYKTYKREANATKTKIKSKVTPAKEEEL